MSHRLFPFILFYYLGIVGHVSALMLDLPLSPERKINTAQLGFVFFLCFRRNRLRSDDGEPIGGDLPAGH
jgi:hypothetical protein